MKARTWFFLLLLFGLFGAAFLLQSRIKKKEVAAAPRIPLENRLDLIVGGKAPLLRLPSPAKSQKRSHLASSPKPNPKPSSPKPPGTKRWITLQKGQTLYGICVKILQDPGALEQVLKLNGWSEEDARSLKPGTRVQLPPSPPPKKSPTHKRN